MAELRIRTNVYSGPLDLLLFLVRRAEVDIFDLPVAEIAGQYIDELEKMERVDLAFAGEYLVLAAQLLKVKSELVLQQANTSSKAEDPRTSLVKQLLEYKRFRDLSMSLQELQDAALKRHGRPSGLIPVLAEEDAFLDEVTVYDLYREYHRLFREVTPSKPHAVLMDEIPIEEYIRRILAQLIENGEVDFATLFQPTGENSVRRQSVIGNFLAVLELVKSQQIDVEQSQAGIRLLPKRAAPIEAIEAIDE